MTCCLQSGDELADQAGHQATEALGADPMSDAAQSQAKKKKSKRRKRALSAKKRKNLGGFSEFVTMEKVRVLQIMTVCISNAFLNSVLTGFSLCRLDVSKVNHGLSSAFRRYMPTRLLQMRLMIEKITTVKRYISVS